MMKNDDFNLLRGFADGQTDGLTDEQTDICDCRVASVTENEKIIRKVIFFNNLICICINIDFYANVAGGDKR